MARKSRSVDEVIRMSCTARQTVDPSVTKTVGEPRSPRLFSSRTADPEQSTGFLGGAARQTDNPHSKGGRRSFAHLDDWKASLEASGRGVDYVTLKLSRVRASLMDVDSRCPAIYRPTGSNPSFTSCE